MDVSLFYDSYYCVVVSVRDYMLSKAHSLSILKQQKELLVYAASEL